MPTNAEVFENGDLIESWPCDWDPINACCQSNGSVEAKFDYRGKRYVVFTDLGISAVYLELDQAKLVNDVTTYIRLIKVEDENGNIQELELHKSPTGGYFAVEAEFIDQVGESIWDPFTAEPTLITLGE